MKFAILVALLTLPCSAAQSQSVSVDTLAKYGRYDTDRLPPSFHAGRREKVLGQLGPTSVALFMAAPERVRSNDDDYMYHQDPNFYYLTGHLESHSALLLFGKPMAMGDGGTTREIIFVQQRDPAQETWTGKRLGPDGAISVLGFHYALSYDSLASYLKLALPTADTLLYQPFDRQMAMPLLDTTWMFWESTKDALAKKYRKLVVMSPQHMLAVLRAVKTPEEMVLLRRAISISNMAHNEIIKSVRPGWYEYQIQALGEYIFAKNGCEYVGYPSIVGSGENSTILHYETNRRQTKTGDFVEMDMGGEYHGYTADITRSYPVDGHFTQAQAAIYDLVLEAQDSGIAAARAGNSFKETHFAALSVIKRGLLKLGILKDTANYKQYFMHGTSHYLGLDVHDAGPYDTLRAGNVVTVEPGIYMKAGSDCDPKWWNIGCRIEDDILITDGAPVILSAASPRKRVDVERLMHSH